MPIQKFRSFEEARRALWVFEPDDEYFRRLEEFFEFAYEVSPFRVMRGVRKYKSIDDPQRKIDFFFFRPELADLE